MNRTDRLLGIILELQAKGWQRAEDLATHFGVSKRTIYRDMQALDETGVPVVSEPGRGYRIVEGYFLPPLHFTFDEALMALLGSELMRQMFDEGFGHAADGAVQKINTALPAPLRSQIQQMQSRFRLVDVQTPARQQIDGKLRLLRRAIVESRRLRFRYHSRPHPHHPPSATERDVDPYALVHVNEGWYLVAYCHLRRAVRHFRLERVEQPRMVGGYFQRDETIPMQIQSGDLSLRVRVLFAPGVSRWVLEKPSFYQTQTEETTDGLLVTLHVRQPEDVLQWLLGWGAQVRVLEPDSLRQRMIDEIEQMRANYEIAEALLP